MNSTAKLALLVATLLSILAIAAACGGKPGRPGANGEDGQSCTVQQLEEGALVTCPDGSFALIEHGKKCKKEKDDE